MKHDGGGDSQLGGLEVVGRWQIGWRDGGGGGGEGGDVASYRRAAATRVLTGLAVFH